MKENNHLFPVFLKLENLRLLIVGGGSVALEKLKSVVGNAPETSVKLVAKEISEEVVAFAAAYPKISLHQKKFEEDDLRTVELVIAAVNDLEFAEQLRSIAKQKGLLINVADKPDLCDFYLGSVVQKGNLKIAISTNGKSPTIAKRIKQVLHEMLPDEIDNVLANVEKIRSGLQGGFSEKVRKLNHLTEILVAKQANLKEFYEVKEKKWQKIVKLCLFAFCFILLGSALSAIIDFKSIGESLKTIPGYIDTNTFLLMLLTGFLAQMVDGSMGMGYGTISTTFLLAIGVNPAIVSSRVHTARVFSSGVTGYSHHRFGNINKKLFKTLAVPGVIGAVLGACLAYYGQNYSKWVRLPLAFYTAYLGIYIIRKAFKKKSNGEKVKKAGWLATVGGFLDAFAGGGWGTLVTSTLIAKRKNIRYVIGSVCLAEFFVVLSSSITFFILLKHISIADIMGLILGGVIAGPIAAKCVGKFPVKPMFIAVGSMVVLLSIFTLYKFMIALHK